MEYNNFGRKIHSKLEICEICANLDVVPNYHLSWIFNIFAVFQRFISEVSSSWNAMVVMQKQLDQRKVVPKRCWSVCTRAATYLPSPYATFFPPPPLLLCFSSAAAITNSRLTNTTKTIWPQYILMIHKIRHFFFCRYMTFLSFPFSERNVWISDEQSIQFSSIFLRSTGIGLSFHWVFRERFGEECKGSIFINTFLFVFSINK